MRNAQIEKGTDLGLRPNRPDRGEGYFSQVSNQGDQNNEILKRGQSRWSFQGDQISELLKRGSVSGIMVRGLKKVFYSRA